MGRELRRVIANWEHPKSERYGEKRYEPMYNRSYLAELEEWLEAHRQWEAGIHEDQDPAYRFYAEYGGNPPCVERYRPDWKEEEMTWWQVYETVSEGTPVTPPFATREELVEYLVRNGDFWDQRRRLERTSGMNCAPWTRKQAESFVFGDGWAPSLISVVQGGQVRISDGVRAVTELGGQP